MKPPSSYPPEIITHATIVDGRMAETDFNECGMSIEYQVIKMIQLGDETWHHWWIAHFTSATSMDQARRAK